MGLWLRGLYPPKILKELFRSEVDGEVDLIFAEEFLSWVERELRQEKRIFRSTPDIYLWLTGKMHQFFNQQL